VLSQYKKVLFAILPLVSFLTTAFGGLVLNVAPPVQTDSKLPLGLAGFVVLFVLLALSSLTRSRTSARTQRHWLVSGVATFVVFSVVLLVYARELRLSTYEFPEHSGTVRVRGQDVDLTIDARNFLSLNRDEIGTAENLASNLGPERVWTAESIESASNSLLLGFGALVLALSTSFFCLLESARLRFLNVDTLTKASSGRK
jgi:hypothetical protein